MKRNIDLTFNGDFQEKANLDVMIKHMENQKLVIGGSRIRDNKLKSSEINSNFVTGSSSSIQEKRWKLRLHRNLNLVEVSCDKCGGFLYIKQKTLCDKCDRQLEEEVHKEYLHWSIERCQNERF